MYGPGYNPADFIYRGVLKEMGKRRALTLTKIISFILLFWLVLSCVSSVLVRPHGYANMHYQWMNGFFEEPTDSLDAVFIGASNVYTSWLPPVAWEKYGIKVWTFGSSMLGGDCFGNIIKNTQSIQPNTLYIISINSFLMSSGDIEIHKLIDYWPTVNRFKMVCDLFNEGQFGSSEFMEYMMPLIRFHDRWNRLDSEDFHYKDVSTKGGTNYDEFLNTSIDVTSSFYETEIATSINSKHEKDLSKFLSYCKENNVRILFVGIPWAVNEKSRKEEMNYITNCVLNSGFDIINLANDLCAVGLDPKTDYYNDQHLNIHGALKVTDYLSQYLLAHYDFPEKSGGGYESWDEAYDKYKEMISPYLTEEELNILP